MCWPPTEQPCYSHSTLGITKFETHSYCLALFLPDLSVPFAKSGLRAFPGRSTTGKQTFKAVQSNVSNETTSCLRTGFSSSALLTLWTRYSFAVGTVLCTAGQLAASLASTHWMAVARPSSTRHDNQKSLHTLPHVSQGAKSKSGSQERCFRKL